MTESKAAEVLAAHNAWRRDSTTDMTTMADPTELGQAIEVAVEVLSEQDGYARLLEKHNNLHKNYIAMLAVSEARVSECEQLRADAARLDWIAKGGQWVFTRLRTSTAPDAPRYWCIEDWDGDDLTEDMDESDRGTLRAAIDAAIAKETK